MKRLLVLSTLLLLATTPAFAGYHYLAETTADGEDSKMGAMTVEGWVDGEKAKILFKESNNPMMQTGTFLVTTDGGKRVLLVNPAEETYSVWDLEALLSTVGNAMESMGGLMKMEVSDPKVEKLAEKSGGNIAGYPTTYYHYRTSYDMNIKVMGMKQSSHTESEQEMWSTTALKDEGFFVWLRNAPAKTGFEAFDKLADAEFEKLKGFPLKSITRTVTTNKKGRASTSTSTTEVTMLDKTSVSGSTFEVDPTYREVPMMQAGGAMPAQQGEDSEEKEESGGRLGKWRKKLGG